MKTQASKWTVTVTIAVSVTALLAAGAVALEASEKETFACQIGALTPTERHAQEARMVKLKEAVTDTQETATGYAFKIDEAKLDLADLVSWIAIERKCCPFFEFDLEVAPHAKGAWLKLGGAAGVKAFIAEELAIQKP